MSITRLPENPSLENLKKQAKTLVKSARAGDPEALDLIGPYFGDPRAIGLQSAQLVLARSYGFSSWAKLKAQVERRTATRELTGDQLANQFLDLVTVIYSPIDDLGPKRFARARDLLAQHPRIRIENIYTAAAIGDVAQIDRWLDRSPGLVNRKGGYFNWEPLMYAAYARLPGSSTLDAGLRLLERGADPNAYYMWGGRYKFTALTGVFGQGEGGPVKQPEHPDYRAFARALLERGANPNDSQAAYNRCFEPDNSCFELLLEFGLAAKDRNNWLLCDDDRLVSNPSETMHFHLIQSIHRGYFERAKLLIDHGVDLNKLDDTYQTRTKGRTPYEAALLLGESRIADILLAKGAVRSKLSNLDRYQAACMAGDRQEARRLLEADADLGSKAMSLQRELLCDAVKQGKEDALRAMIDLEFDLNPAGLRTPLQEAALTGDIDLVRLLLDAGADPTLRDPDHFGVAIGFALYAGHDEIVALLDTVEMDIFTAAARGRIDQIEARLAEDPSCLEMRFAEIRPGKDKPCDNDWITPLVAAVFHQRAEAVRYLLDQGADPGVKDDEGRSLPDLAKEHAPPEIAALIASASGT